MLDDSIRIFLLKEVGKFVERVKGLQGVCRIALVGSLTTSKRDPKDADVLVTIDTDIDIASLSTCGRKLKGACQNRAKGADIFLCNVAGEYIGRTCSYKVCHMRVACKGHSCGNRSYLCDDLDMVCLDSELVQEPPIEVWPRIVSRVQVPGDVDEYLLKPLMTKDKNDG